PKAHPPAKAAPKTSAEIRIAADSTVETLTQLMRRWPRGRLVASSMARNEYQRPEGIKPANCAGLTRLNGPLDRFRECLHNEPEQSAACRLDRVVRGAAARRDQARALRAGVRAGTDRAPARG